MLRLSKEFPARVEPEILDKNTLSNPSSSALGQLHGVIINYFK
jgi:hypothetical protein